jgi:aminoglycoside phosphotransferase (APT) family kinase protein
MVLRRPPKKVRPARIDGMRREIRLARALAQTDVPHARLIAADEGEELMGTPFYVMNLIDGWSSNAGWPAPFDTDLAARAGLGYELVDGAARLAAVDWRAVGLEGFGKPDAFHERQVGRWTSFLADFKIRELPGMDSATAFLDKARPAHFTPGIMHGDYQFPNVMFAHGAPAKLAAVLDFEMSTIGDPLLDLAWALIAWPPDDAAIGHTNLSFEGMPSRDDLLEHYAKVSGLPVDEFDYYLVLARFKLAIMLEQSFSRMSQMDNPPPVAAHLDTLVLSLMRSAGSLAQTSALGR